MIKTIAVIFILAFGSIVKGQQKNDVFYSLAEAFGQEESVKELELSGNYTDDSLVHLKRFPNLESLTLKNFTAGELPTSIAHITWLKKMKIINGNFYSFPVEYTNLENLESLELVHDTHLELRSTFFLLNRLPSLKELRIEGLQSQSFTEDLVFPENLELLSLRNNHLNSIPPAVSKLQNLSTLDLGGNELLELPQWLSNLPKLTVLYLDDLPYLRFDHALEIVGNIKSLRELHLERNNLSRSEVVQTVNPSLTYIFTGNKTIQSKQGYYPNLKLPPFPKHSSNVEDGSFKIRF